MSCNAWLLFCCLFFFVIHSIHSKNGQYCISPCFWIEWAKLLIYCFKKNKFKNDYYYYSFFKHQDYEESFRSRIDLQFCKWSFILVSLNTSDILIWFDQEVDVLTHCIKNYLAAPFNFRMSISVGDHHMIFLDTAFWIFPLPTFPPLNICHV